MRGQRLNRYSFKDPPDDTGYPQGDGFNAFGYPVSTERQVGALDCAIEDMGVTPFLADSIITEAAGYIEADRVDLAVQVLMVAVDLTGAYRLIAVMCTP